MEGEAGSRSRGAAVHCREDKQSTRNGLNIKPQLYDAVPQMQWLETMLTPFSSSIVMMENAQQLCSSHLVVSWPHSSPGIICIKCSISSTIIPIMNGQYILQKIANIDICSGPLYQLDRMQGQGNSTNQIFTS